MRYYCRSRTGLEKIRISYQHPNFALLSHKLSYFPYLPEEGTPIRMSAFYYVGAAVSNTKELSPSYMYVYMVATKLHALRFLWDMAE